MERLLQIRILLRQILAQHYVDTHPLGAEVEDWLLRWGGWFPDPQVHYGDGSSRLQDEGVDCPCPDVIAALEHSELLLCPSGSYL
jgi:hypothetical protein